MNAWEILNRCKKAFFQLQYTLVAFFVLIFVWGCWPRLLYLFNVLCPDSIQMDFEDLFDLGGALSYIIFTSS